MPAVDAFSAFTGANGGTPSGGGPCPPCPPATMDWVVLQSYDLTTVDTASATTTTGGDIALTVGGNPFLTLKTISGSGTGSITPTNGTGLVFNVAAAGTRGGHFDIDWASFGCDPSFDGVGFMWEWSFTSIVDGGAIVPMLHTVGSSFSVNYSVGPRWNRSSTNHTTNARFYNSAANISGNWANVAGFSGTYSGAAVILPGGFAAWAHDGAMPADPSVMTYGPRRAAVGQAWATTPLFFPNGPPKAAFAVDSAVCAWRKISLVKWGV